MDDNSTNTIAQNSSLGQVSQPVPQSVPDPFADFGAPPAGAPATNHQIPSMFPSTAAGKGEAGGGILMELAELAKAAEKTKQQETAPTEKTETKSPEAQKSPEQGETLKPSEVKQPQPSQPTPQQSTPTIAPKLIAQTTTVKKKRQLAPQIVTQDTLTSLADLEEAEFITKIEEEHGQHQ